MTWWEVSDTEYNGEPIFFFVACPVCNKTLGKKEKEESAAFHCEECKALYTFYPGVAKPTAKLDRDIAKTCQCPSCRANRGEIELEEPLI